MLRRAGMSCVSRQRRVGRFAVAPLRIKPYVRGIASEERESASTAPPGKPSTVDRLKLIGLHNALLITGGAITTYAVAKSMLYVTNTFLHVNFTTVGEFGFVGGVLCTTAAVYVGRLGYRFAYIVPDRVFRESLKMVKRSDDARALLKASSFDGVKAGKVRAYMPEGGYVGISGGFGWKSPRIKMIYQVYTSKAQAQVCVEASKRMGGSLQWDLVSLEPIRNCTHDSAVFIRGDPDIESRKELLDFVNLKKNYSE